VFSYYTPPEFFNHYIKSGAIEQENCRYLYVALRDAEASAYFMRSWFLDAFI